MDVAIVILFLVIIFWLVGLAVERKAGRDWRNKKKWLTHGCSREMTRKEYRKAFSNYKLWKLGYLQVWVKEDAKDD